MFRLVLRTVYLLCLALGLILSLTGGNVSADGREIRVLQVKGNIVPVVSDYISRGISEAEQAGSVACIIELDTPGGLLNSTEDIVRRIMNAGVPVVVYVYPHGAWAASAGTFITVSAHLSAMAPATSIGAAHPVSVGEEMPADTQKKATEYSVAWIQSIAEKRGRDPALVEAAVRESKSFTASQAVESKLVDFLADDLGGVIRQIDGKTVTLADGRTVTIDTDGAVIVRSEMNGVENFLHMISHPNMAYILMTVASIGIITEISNPGLIFPGVIGGICLFFAFYALGVLNAYWAGVLLILLAVGLFITEIFVPAYGILTTGGIISLVIGSLILFSESEASMQVDIGLIVVTAIFFAGFVAFLVWATIRGQTRKVTTGREGIIGQSAIVKTALEPKGMVLVEGELWKAELDSGNAQPGEEVVIQKVDNLKLYVTRKK
ncbi:MAG: nodulation protein NfeD [Dehalococcoidia bacterium]|nr:nodulation protein NfeD [Dehalococcoidia bacterium]MDD5493402.1 nodulation protein NfeD [Dehalococcoidia bacterium]